jgi:hypothetical protein
LPGYFDLSQIYFLFIGGYLSGFNSVDKLFLRANGISGAGFPAPLIA